MGGLPFCRNAGGLVFCPLASTIAWGPILFSGDLAKWRLKAFTLPVAAFVHPVLLSDGRGNLCLHLAPSPVLKEFLNFLILFYNLLHTLSSIIFIYFQ